jgi:hypothetical protein
MLEVDHPLYLILADGPICCAGIIALLIVVLGVVLMLSGANEETEDYDQDDEPFQQPLG